MVTFSRKDNELIQEYAFPKDPTKVSLDGKEIYEKYVKGKTLDDCVFDTLFTERQLIDKVNRENRKMKKKKLEERKSIEGKKLKKKKKKKKKGSPRPKVSKIGLEEFEEDFDEDEYDDDENPPPIRRRRRRRSYTPPSPERYSPTNLSPETPIGRSLEEEFNRLHQTPQNKLKNDPKILFEERQCPVKHVAIFKINGFHQATASVVPDEEGNTFACKFSGKGISDLIDGKKTENEAIAEARRVTNEVDGNNDTVIAEEVEKEFYLPEDMKGMVALDEHELEQRSNRTGKKRLQRSYEFVLDYEVRKGSFITGAKGGFVFVAFHYRTKFDPQPEKKRIVQSFQM